MEAVVFDDERFSRKQAQRQRRESRAGDVEDIARANEAPELKQAWLANDAERKRAVIEIFCWFLRHQNDFEFAGAIRIAELGKAASKRKDDGLNATNTRGKKVRIDQQLHVIASPASCRDSP